MSISWNVAINLLLAVCGPSLRKDNNHKTVLQFQKKASKMLQGHLWVQKDGELDKIYDLKHICL